MAETKTALMQSPDTKCEDVSGAPALKKTNDVNEHKPEEAPVAAAEPFVEPLLREPVEPRHTVFPLPANEIGIYARYKFHRSTFWSVEEVSMKGDTEAFANLTKDQQHYLSYTLAFFASSDEMVGENIDENFSREIKNLSAQKFFTFQKAIEDIHSEMYSLMITEYVPDAAQQKKLLNAVVEIPCIKKKADWLRGYMDRSVPFVQRLFAFICFEAICFASSFAAIFYFRSQFPGIMKGLVFSNTLIAKDEGLHAEFGMYLYTNHIVNKMSDEDIHEMIREVVAIERNFVSHALPSSLIGIDPQDMCKFVEFNADRVLETIGHPKIYNHHKCPVDLMELINLQIKTNFFEGKAGEYSKTTVHEQELVISEDEDF